MTKTGKHIPGGDRTLCEPKYVSESMVHGVDDDEEAGTTVGIQVHPAYDIIYEELVGIRRCQHLQVDKGSNQDINDKLPVYKRIRNVSMEKTSL